MKNQIKRQPGRDINDIILTLVFLIVFALTSGYYMLTSNVASLKIHPNDASIKKLENLSTWIAFVTTYLLWLGSHYC